MITYAASAPKIHGSSELTDATIDDFSLLTNLTLPLESVDASSWGMPSDFAFAGHRNGYGQPLGDVDKLQEGDPIIVRTQDYWYVYHYTSYKIVLPTQTEVVAANPENPGATPTKRMLTMTTCEPKYSTPTHRWISYAEFSYWAKVSDGIPQELASQNANGTVKFVNNEQSSFLSSIGRASANPCSGRGRAC